MRKIALMGGHCIFYILRTYLYFIVERNLHTHIDSVF